MKKILKLVLITITVCAMTLSAEITTVEGIEWSYTVTAEGAVVDKLYPRISGTQVSIPATLDGNTVIGIGSSAFEGFTGLTGVKIPSTVKYIYSGAFSRCSSIREITVPNGVKEIGAQAFENCSSLKEVVLPSDLSVIGRYAFSGCSEIESISFPENLTHIGDHAFEGCAKLSSVSIPGRTVYVGEYAFSGCSALMKVNMEEGVQKIGSYAFKDCTLLQDINIPESVLSIGYNAFDGCDGQLCATDANGVRLLDGWIIGVPIDSQILRLPEAKGICEAVFWGCQNLTHVSISDGIEHIGDFPFALCEELVEIDVSQGNKVYASINGMLYNKLDKSVVCCPSTKKDAIIPEDTLTIASGAFYNCTVLSNVVFNSSVGSIGGSAFFKCNSLLKIEIPQSVTNIGGAAFRDCASLTNIVIPEKVASIESSVFDGCTSLKSISILNPFVEVCNSMLHDEEGSLEEVVVPQCACERSNGIKFLFPGQYSKIRQIRIANGVTNITRFAFSGCESMTEIVIPNTVTQIGEDAFDGCSGVRSVIIPYGITNIAWTAFLSCSGVLDATVPGYMFGMDLQNVTNIVISQGTTNIANNAFSEAKQLLNVLIPDSVISIGKNAFSECSSLTELIIPSGVDHIGNCAFMGCERLRAFSVSIDNPSFSSIDGLLLSKDGKTVVCGVNGRVSIPQGVTTIADSAFWGYRGLVSVAIPSTVSSIGWRAFRDCSNLEGLIISDGLRSIGDSAFAGCKALTDVIIPPSVTDIKSSAFSGCESLTDIVLPFIGARRGGSGREDSLFGYIFGTQSYDGGLKTCQWISSTQATTNYIPESLKAVRITDESVVSAGAFSGCNGLERILIPETVTDIEAMAFYGCSSLLDMPIPYGVSAIKSQTFYACTNLANVNFPGSVTTIGYRAFCDCRGLKNLTIPYSVENIGFSAFYNCDGVVNLTLPAKFQDDSKNAFYGVGRNRYYYHIPPIAADASPMTVRDAIESVGFADEAAIQAGIGGSVKRYMAFKEWVRNDTSGLPTPREEAVKDSPNAWLSYAMDADKLIEGEITDGDLKVEAFTLSQESGLFDMKVRVADVSIGSGALLENLARTFVLEGTQSLTEDFSVENVTVEFSESNDGAVALSVLPNESNNNAFFVRPRLRNQPDINKGNSCEVSFDLNGGGDMPDGMSAKMFMEYASAYGELPEPMREGYVFHGWYTAALGGEKVTSATEVPVIASQTLYARWRRVSNEKVQLWKGGPFWATKNIGAEEPWQYGYYFWWGDTIGYIRENDKWVASDGSKSNFSFEWDTCPVMSKTTSPLQSEGWITSDGSLALEHDAACVQWGGDWRMPTKQDLNNLSNKCDWTWTTMNGVNGYVVRGKGDYASASIFLPCAGYASGDSLYDTGARGCYWSSVPVDGNSHAYSLDFYLGLGCLCRYNGQTIRPVQWLASDSAVARPADVSATDGTSSYCVTVTWSSSTGATSYEIWRNTTSDCSSARKIGTSAYTRYSDSSVTPGKSYYYWVKAVTSVGTSAFGLCDSGYVKKIVTSVAISGASSLLAGETTKFTCTATYNDGVSEVVAPVWSISSGADYATLSSDGALTANGIITQPIVTLQASYTYGGVLKTATKIVAVNIKPVTITFNANGGSVLPLNRRTYTAYGKYAILPIPTRSGCEFLGWFTAKEDGVQVTESSIVPSEDATLCAQWYRNAKDDKVQLWEGGPYWATRNIGAENLWEYGRYFWWGDTSDNSADFSFWPDKTPTDGKSISILQQEGWVTADSVLTSEHDAANVQWGEDWRMPTKQELDDLNDKCDWTWATMNGVKGYIVKGKGAYASASIFLPCAGYCIAKLHVDAGSYYWSSTPDSNSNNYAWTLYFASDNHYIENCYRYYGLPVRPVAASVPGIPTNVIASDGTSSDSVTITWLASTGATSYEIWRGTSTSSSTAEKIGTSSSTSYSDVSAKPGTMYYYWVTAVSSVGTSTFSVSDSGYVKTVVTSVAISGVSSLLAGETTTFTCIATYNDGITGVVTPVWSILAGGSYAKINSLGLLEAECTSVARSVTLQASYTYGGVTKTATKTVTVNIKTVAITFNANGGAVSPATKTYTAYAAYGTLPVPTREGFKFTGWFTEPVDGEMMMEESEVESASAQTLYARWEPTHKYCIVDISSGANAVSYSVAYLDAIPSGGWTDEYKTTKLVLRRIDTGYVGEVEDSTTLPAPYYIGLFEITQRQYALVTGNNPSYSIGDILPVEQVSWNTIRGDATMHDWPEQKTVDSNSFMGRLCARTGIKFDMPTVIQWEYACRAGTQTAYSYGDDADGNYMWYLDNANSTSHVVGTCLPNPWGLFDMHGNAWEWCLDKLDSSNSERAACGGAFNSPSSRCKSSSRAGTSSEKSNRYYGFRVAIHLNK